MKGEMIDRLMDKITGGLSERVIDYGSSPRNYGELENPDSYARITGPCGDTMEIFLKTKNENIEDISYTTDGCMTSHAAGSAVTVMANGKPVKECIRINQSSVLEHLGGMPSESEHCALLAAETLHKALGNYATDKKELMLLTDWFDRHVNRYRNGEGTLPAALELKYLHSQRVAENARLIAQGLGLKKAEILLAEGCGLVHDIERFSQYACYGSFHDADTVDHGKEGRRILEIEGVQSHFDAADWESIAWAVEYHNKKASDIPSHLDGETGLLLRLVRDADKLDIMDLVMQSVASDGFSELPDMLPQIRTGRELTPGVMEELLKNKTVSVDHLRTVTDFVVMLASWFYDLNYAFTRCLAADRHILQRIAIELPDTKDIRELLTDIRAHL